MKYPLVRRHSHRSGFMVYLCFCSKLKGRCWNTFLFKTRMSRVVNTPEDNSGSVDLFPASSNATPHVFTPPLSYSCVWEASLCCFCIVSLKKRNSRRYSAVSLVTMQSYWIFSSVRQTGQFGFVAGVQSAHNNKNQYSPWQRALDATLFARWLTGRRGYSLSIHHGVCTASQEPSPV